MERTTYSGTIIFLKTNEGTKSECLAPYLYRGKDEPPLSVMIKDDNPFENNALQSYDGQRVELSGIQTETTGFIADEIKSI